MNIYYRRLLDKLVSTNNKKDMSQLLEAILTPKELEAVPNRLEIIRLIRKGVPQHKIAKKLGVGIATITRGSKEYKKNIFTNV